MKNQVRGTDRSRQKVRSALLQLATGFIGNLTATCAVAQDTPPSNHDAWHFAVTPYLWMVDPGRWDNFGTVRS